MKKIINKLLLVVATSLIATSCEDFLNVPPVGSLGSDAFYKTPTQAEQGIVGVYMGLGSLTLNEFIYMSEVRSDNIWCPQGPNGFKDHIEISAFRAAYDIGTFNGVWNSWYKVIYDANIAIQKIEGLDFGANTAQKNQFLGEAHFLRGWAYFELVRLFGNVPLVDRAVSPTEAASIAQSSATDIYNNIVIPDLTFAAENLPTDANMLISGAKKGKSGRANQLAAQAMLARVYMTMAGFPLNDASAAAKAKTALETVITAAGASTSNPCSGPYWAPDSTEWQKQWMEEYNNKYTLFAVQYRSGGQGNPVIFQMGGPSGEEKANTAYSSFRMYNINDFFAEKSLAYEFSLPQSNGNLDARGVNQSVILSTISDGSTPARLTQFEPLTPGSTIQAPANAACYKFFESKIKRAYLGMTDNIEAKMTGYNDWGLNFPIIRYEDMVLMYAELIASSNPTGAMSIVNKIRERAGCDPAVGDVMTAIKHERRLELCLEGVRWFDLVRWNEWKQTTINLFDSYNHPQGVVDDNVKDGRYLYPIPKGQMDVKPGLYKQNEGY